MPNSTSEPEGKPPVEFEEHFGQLTAGVQDYAIFLLTPQGFIKSWNAGAQRIKGYTADEIIGKHFSTFYSQEAKDAGFPDHELKVAAELGRFEDEGWRIRKDGTRIWANVVITALRDRAGELRGYLKITRDLTERKLAEELVRQSEERFRLLIEGVQDYAIFSLDPRGYIVSWNTGAQRIKGYAPGEIIGKHFSCFYPPEDIAAKKPERELQIAGREGRVEDEGWRVRKDRSLFWANVIITALYDKDGGIRGFAKVTRDLTGQRQLESLKHADQQKNQFLAMLAHELRNPLAPIRNGLQLLGMPGVDAATMQETTAMMDRQIDHLVRLVDDLLDVSRIVNGKINLQLERVDMSAVLARSIEESQPVIDARGHELMVTLPARPIEIDGDLVRLAQVFSNLLNNAAKYSQKPGRIWLTAERSGPEVAVRVRDGGIGIRADFLPNIFDLFVQIDDSLAHSEGGLGIGLTLVKRIVEMHQGRVTATSPGLGQGSEFVVQLPLPQEQGKPVNRVPVRKPAAAQSGRKIVVVDDNVDAATTVSTLLKLWGHEVKTVYNGPSALEMVRSFKPQLVLLDIGLPGMSGYEVARQLRSQPEFREVTIAALTGYGQSEDRQRSFEAGFDHHLTKPPDPNLLQALLSAAPHSGKLDRPAGQPPKSA